MTSGQPSGTLPRTMKKPQNKVEKKQLIRNHATSVQLYQHHQGPLPDPQTLAHYDQILPGAAERILVLAENQQAHRHSLESKAIGTDSRNSLAGIVSAFVISMTTILAGGYVATSGAEWPGVLLGTSGLASVVGVFIYGTQQRRKEREQKVRLLKG
jgi:uncharacterized membrane protein